MFKIIIYPDNELAPRILSHHRILQGILAQRKKSFIIMFKLGVLFFLRFVLCMHLKSLKF
jgi:hypothetical protein